MCLDSPQWVVQQNNVSVSVGGSRETDALLLAAAQVHALLADLGGIPGRQELEIAQQCAAEYHLVVPVITVWIQKYEN